MFHPKQLFSAALKMVHEKNSRVSLCVQDLFHPQDLGILATGFPSQAHGPHFQWVFGFRLDCVSLVLAHSIDAGLGIQPSISCVDDVGVVGVDELDGEGSVVKPGTTIGT